MSKISHCESWVACMIRAGFFLALACLAVVAKEPPRVNPDAAALKEFMDRVEEYAALSKRIWSGIEKLKGTTDPAKIAEYQKAAAAAIQQARSDAKPGDIFIPAVRPRLLRIIRNELRRPGGQHIWKAIMDENPGPLNIKVNGPYPEGAPLTTVPPSLLRALPRLPEGLEYRFVDRHLILRDRVAGIIVDYIPEAIPPVDSSKRRGRRAK